MRKLLLSGVSALAIAMGGVATADEMNNSWSGGYAGLHLGYGFGGPDGVYQYDNGSIYEARMGNADGLVYGVHAGVNWQSGNFVYGVEGDVSFSDMGDFDRENDTSDATATIDGEVDTLASLRLRLGYAMDDMLVYATGGLAYADANFDVHDSDEFADFSLGGFGAVVGGGAQMRVSERASVGLEGLYYLYNDKKSDFSNILDSSGQEEDFVKLDNIFVVRLRMDFQF